MVNIVGCGVINDKSMKGIRNSPSDTTSKNDDITDNVINDKPAKRITKGIRVTTPKNDDNINTSPECNMIDNHECFTKPITIKIGKINKDNAKSSENTTDNTITKDNAITKTKRFYRKSFYAKKKCIT